MLFVNRLERKKVSYRHLHAFAASASQDDTDIVICHEKNRTSISLTFRNTREMTAGNRDESL